MGKSDKFKIVTPERQSLLTISYLVHGWSLKYDPNQSFFCRRPRRCNDPSRRLLTIPIWLLTFLGELPNNSSGPHTQCSQLMVMPEWPQFYYTWLRKILSKLT